jgi:hypothetical protein
VHDQDYWDRYHSLEPWAQHEMTLEERRRRDAAVDKEMEGAVSARELWSRLGLDFPDGQKSAEPLSG